MNVLRIIIQNVIHSLYFTYRKNIMFFLLVLYLCFSHSVTIAQVCKGDSGLIKDIQSIACATSDLRKAVAKDDLLDKVAAKNFFMAIKSNDVVRSVESLSFFNRSLVSRIEETHEKYQEASRKNYTLNITSYPSKVEKGSCSQQKTIDFNSSRTTPYPDYQVIPGKKPRSFEIRYYKGKFIICEKTDIPYPRRLSIYCGKEGNADRECKKELPLSCDYVDKKGGKVPSQDTCLNLDGFTELSQDLLMYND